MARQFDPYETFRTEPSMRQEFNNTMDGAFPEMSKRQKIVLRKMRLSGNSLIQCSCVDSLTHEPDKDTFCPYCFGDGYLWDETIHDGYKVTLGSPVGQANREELIATGNVNLINVTFYFRYSFTLNVFPNSCSLPHGEFPDKIVELVTDDAGVPVQPYKRRRIYRIGNASDLRSDSGRLEYWILNCFQESVKFLNGPQG